MTSLEDLEIDVSNLKTESNEIFDVLVIKPNEIKDLDWCQQDYIDKLLEKDFHKIEKLDPKKYMENISSYLDLGTEGKYDVQVTAFFEDREHIYELIYLNQENSTEGATNHTQTYDINEFATLLSINGEKVYGNAIVLKTYLPIKDYTMKNVDLKLLDLKHILNRRINTKIVVYEDEFRELDIQGSIEEFANKFFENMYYQKKEFIFLLHNVNIWYTTFDYGEEVCGKLLNKKIDKCIVFSMYTDVHSTDFTLNEFNKMKFLSNKLDNFYPDPEIHKEEKDDLGRKIIKNKHRILEKTYNSNQ